MSFERLNPCPFCGSPNVHTTNDRTSLIVLCGRCSARGPAHCSEKEAVAGWNALRYPQAAALLDWLRTRPEDETVTFTVPQLRPLLAYIDDLERFLTSRQLRAIGGGTDRPVSQVAPTVAQVPLAVVPTPK